jgi:hypothetical protein
MRPADPAGPPSPLPAAAGGGGGLTFVASPLTFHCRATVYDVSAVDTVAQVLASTVAA